MTDARDTMEYLQDIANALEAAQTFVHEMEPVQFRADQRTIYAVTHALEIAGEAARHIPPDVRARYADVPWRLMAGMRDRLIHGYDTVDPDVLWKTLTEDVPATRKLIAAVIRQEQDAASGRQS